MNDFTPEQEAVVRGMLQEYGVLYAQLHDHALSICRRLRIPRRPEWTVEPTPVVLFQILGELESRVKTLERTGRAVLYYMDLMAKSGLANEPEPFWFAELRAALGPGAVGEGKT